MRRVLLSLAVTALVAAALPAGAAAEPEAPPTVEAPAEAPPPAPKPKPAKDDPDRIVCVRQHVVGSNRPQKVCMTVAERDRLRDATARLLSDQRGGSAPPAGPGIP
jgi:hypothetical protein